MTYILIHGAWHANWCWKNVIPLLEKEGHKVIAPNLPGHGKHTISLKDISLQTYIDSVKTLIQNHANPVILVGHSMAGVVISQVAEEIPELIKKLIYISGFVPDYSGALIHEEGKTKTPSVTKEIEVDEYNGEISLKQSARIKELFYNQCSEEDAKWALSQLQKQPLRPFVDTVSLTDTRFGRVEKLYIECLRDEAIRIEDQRRMHSKIKCEVASLDTDHSPFLSQAHELAEILHETALKNEIKGRLNLSTM